MSHAAVTPAATPPPEPEAERQGSSSPCTPPPQTAARRSETDAVDEQPEKPRDILEWSPQTPESLPVMTVKDIISAGAVSLDLDFKDGATTAPPETHSKEESKKETEEKPRKEEGEEAVDAVAVEAPDTHAAEEAADASSCPSVPVAVAPASASPPVHVDPQTDTTKGDSDPTSTDGPTDTGSITAAVEQPQRSSSVFFPSDTDATVSAALFVAIAAFCDLPSTVQLMRVCRASHTLATSDAVWRPILCGMNLPPLLTAYDRNDHLYAFFLDDVVTTRALHGHYTFQAANNVSGSHGSVSNASGSRTGTTGRDAIRDDDSLQEDVFNIASLQLLISAASLGQSNHLIGRVQLLLTYKNDSMEVLQGSCRFSAFRRCFSLCCSAFGTVKRGPVFTVAVATVTKPWANEGFQHFSEHKNGIRLVMTPVLWEGQSPGSQITEKDILVVSRPRPVPAVASTDSMSLLEASTQPSG